MPGTTPKKVNAALKTAGLAVEIVRHPSGYYWFSDFTTAISPIWSNNLRGYETSKIVDHVRRELARIAAERA